MAGPPGYEGFDAWLSLDMLKRLGRAGRGVLLQNSCKRCKLTVKSHLARDSNGYPDPQHGR